MKPLGFAARLKAATTMLFSGYGGQQVNTSGGWDSWTNWGSTPNSNRDYARTVGDLWQNSAVTVCISWMQRTLPEAPVWVQRTQGGTDEEVEGHPFTALLRSPNPYYSIDLLWQKTIQSWVVNGNAYWFKARGGKGSKYDPVLELYHIPWYQMRPLWPPDGTKFIDSYLYSVDGKREVIPAEDIVHFRYGAHPRNERLGWSPLLAALVEIDTDNEAGNYTNAILRNLGIIGGVLSPEDPNQVISEPGKASIKAQIKQQATGDARGGILIADGSLKYQQMGLSPEDLVLNLLRNVPEDRICALLGIPTMVAGLTSGAMSKTYANYKEAREAAYHNNIIPAQEMFAAELQLQLLPDFSSDPTQRVGWDRRKVQALQPDLTEVWTRVMDAKAKGVLTIDEARAELGKEPLPNGEGKVREPIGRAISESPGGPEPLPLEGQSPQMGMNGRNGKKPVTAGEG